MRLEALLLGWALGVAVQLQQPALWSLFDYGLLAVAALLCCWLWSRVVPVPVAAFSATVSNLVLVGLVAALAFAWVGLRATHFKQQALPAAYEGVSLQVTGVVSSLPQWSEQGVRFRLRVESASLQGAPVSLPDWIDLGWWGGPQRSEAVSDVWESWAGAPALRAGDRWQLSVRLKAPHGHRNPHGFDVELWLWEQGVGATGYVRQTAGEAPVRWLGDSGRMRLTRYRQALRDRMLGGDAEAASGRARAVLAALVVGDQAVIERSDWDVFRATGVAHLMSISGLHITLFAWLAMRAGRWLWRRSQRLCLLLPAPVAGRWLGLALAGAYALFSGWGIPAQRTIWMLAIMVALGVSGRRWPWPTVWMLALAAVLCVDPWAMMQAGFWLSFVAVGVLMTRDEDQDTAGDDRAQGVLPRMVRQARRMLREQWLISLALAPLTLVLFQQVSVVGLLANLLAIPCVTLLITPMALLGVVVPGLWWLAEQLTQGLMQLLSVMAAWPWATVSLPASAWPVSLCAVLGALVLVSRVPWSLRLLGIPLVLPLVLHTTPRPASGQFDVLALDVGQGTAVLIRTAQHSLLYDSGPRYGLDSDAGARVVLPLLRAWGEHPDLMVLSHSDLDHTGGAASILGARPDLAVLSSMRPVVASARWQRCHAGQRWQWDGVVFEVLHPSVADYDLVRSPNAMSCVLKVSGSGASMLLTGDIEKEQESRLTQAAAGVTAALRADVLLVPHHGSKTSSTQALLDAVQPRLAVVQAGYRNRFGHPAGDVVQRYERAGIVLVRTDRCGAWSWRSDWPVLAPNGCQRWVQRRYWHASLPPDAG